MTVSWENTEKSPVSGRRPGRWLRPRRQACLERPPDGRSRPYAGGEAFVRSRREHMTRLPDHGDALRLAAFLESQPGWSAFWDKRDGVWRVTEDDPDSELYAESADAGTVIDYIATHSKREVRHDHCE